MSIIAILQNSDDMIITKKAYYFNFIQNRKQKKQEYPYTLERVVQRPQPSFVICFMATVI